MALPVSISPKSNSALDAPSSLSGGVFDSSGWTVAFGNASASGARYGVNSPYGPLLIAGGLLIGGLVAVAAIRHAFK